MSRKRASEGEVIDTLLQQGARVKCPKCGQLFLMGEKFQRHHFEEIAPAIGGKDEVANWVYLHKDCHLIVTNGFKLNRAGSSKHKIAKVKRMAAGGKKRKGRPIPSRPFQKGCRPWR